MDANRVMHEIDDLFSDLETLLKNPDVVAELTARGVNSSLALLAGDALKAYLHGEKARAAEEFCHFGEEVAARLAVGKGSLS